MEKRDQQMHIRAGFVVWDDSMPPAAMTILGNVSNGYGMEEGSPFVMFMYDSSWGNISWKILGLQVVL